MTKNTTNTPKIINKNIDDLIFAEYNPRQLTKDQYQNLKDSLQRFGVVDPILINKNKKRKNIIIGGHQRTKVAKDIGLKKLPCIELDLSLEKEKELNIRLNKNVGEWDYDILANLFDIDELVEFGFKEEELEIMNEPEYEDLIDGDKEKPYEIKIKVKDIDEFDLLTEDLDNYLKKYKTATFSVSGGEI